MNLKIGCCILIYIAITVVESKSLAGKHNKDKQAVKVTKEPKKRISTQQKIGSGHAKGPMANNVQSSVPLPVVMPFPMIPFDDRYPIIFTPNGKPNKGKGKKKDPKGETEDETDKDIDDENDTGEKEYKGAGNVKHGPYSKQRPEMIQSAPVLEEAEREASEADDDKNQATNENETERDGSGDNENEADENSEEDNQQTTQKQIALFPISIQKANENESEPEENDDEADEKEADENESEAQEKQRDSKDNEKRDSKDKQKSLAESLLNSVSKPKKSKSKSKKPRERRETYEPIVGNPEDIMPYLFFGTEEEPVVEGDKAHIITTRSAEEEEYNGIDERTDDYDAPHGMWRRDVDEEEEDEDEARDMRPRSVPDEPPDLPTAEKKYKDTQSAATILTQIQKALGADPENAIEETHSLEDVLRKDMETYDEEIAKDVIATQNAQTRNKVIVSEDGKENAELQDAKRKLQNDRAKENEIRRELKEIKDIELMTTTLELAKYLATENARQQLQVAKSHIQAPQPVIQVPYQSQAASFQAPATYSYSYAPAVQEVQVSRQPVAMAAPWQHVYPQAINYAYNPSHVENNAARHEMESFSQARPSSSLHQETQSAAVHAQYNEASKMPQASFFDEPRYQAPVELPRPGMAVHTEAQSRHVTKPAVVKPRPYIKPRPAAKARPSFQQRPYTQNRLSNARPEQTTASLLGRKPTITFPGPTYSPPPFTTRNGRPKHKYNTNGYNAYNNRYGQPIVKAPSGSPALMTFFSDQRQVSPMANLYQSAGLFAQQHTPWFSHSAYREPVASHEQYHAGGYHNIEKEPAHYDIHVPYIGVLSHPADNQHVIAQHVAQPSSIQPERSASKTQAPASRTQKQPTDYIGTQQGVPAQYALPRPEGPSFGAPAPVMYQSPASYSELIPSSKQGIPSYLSPYAVTQPVARVQEQSAPFYPQQSSRPFETMNTDSSNFHGANGPTQQSLQEPGGKVQNPNEVPLGYGLYPLPENAENKMEQDTEEKRLFASIKDDTERLHDTKKAAEAVTKIENNVGFDPGSIAKLVDFVKQAAEKDVDLSERAVKRDQTTIKRMEIEHVKKSEIGNKQSEISDKKSEAGEKKSETGDKESEAGDTKSETGDKKSDAPNKKSEINESPDAAMNEAKRKLKIDGELLKESQERLQKIKRMELIVTGIEAAKYSAMIRKQEKLNNDVDKINRYRGAKKTVVGRKGFGKRSDPTVVNDMKK